MVLESSLINVLHPNPCFGMTWGLRVNFLAHIWDIYEYIWDIYKERWLCCPPLDRQCPTVLEPRLPVQQHREMLGRLAPLCIGTTQGLSVVD